MLDAIADLTGLGQTRLMAVLAGLAALAFFALFVIMILQLRAIARERRILSQTLERAHEAERTQALMHQEALASLISREMGAVRESGLEQFSRLMQTMAVSQESASGQSAQWHAQLLGRLDAQTLQQQQRMDSAIRSLSDGVGAIRTELDAKLERLCDTNREALGQIRQHVEEKLQETIANRISESFSAVEKGLASVHEGLGQMRVMAQDVSGLRRVLTNVKTRGTFGEVQLSRILEEILLPEQYDVNVATRPLSGERVEFAVRLPGARAGDSVYLPIDAKFPTEDYERLLQASDACDVREVERCRQALERRILAEAAKIREKYVEVPHTTEFAVLYLPVESLWAEVLRIPGLIERVQREHHVTIAGPTVLAALLNSLQMGFRTLAIERKSAEVWQVLGRVKTEFGKFSESISGIEKKIEAIRGSLDQVRTRTSVMNRQLRDIEMVDVTEIGQRNESGNREA